MTALLQITQKMYSGKVYKKNTFKEIQTLKCLLQDPGELPEAQCEVIVSDPS